MRLVLTGAGGFLGTEVLKQLTLHDDVEVLAVSSKADLPGASDFPSRRITIVTPQDLHSNPDLMNGYDVLLNCAFPRNVDGAALARGLDFISSLFAAAATRVKAVVNVSSQSVYSQHRTEPATEETPVCLESTYSVAKYATELLLEEACSDIPHTNIRLASLIGPGFDQRVVNKMVAKALTEGRIVVRENGSLFGYLDVRDAASAVLQVTESKTVIERERVYNVGANAGYTLTEIANSILLSASAFDMFDIDCVIEVDSSIPTNTVIESNWIERDFGWRQQFELNDSIACIMRSMLM